MRRLTDSGCSRCKKWPALLTISISDPSAMKSSGAPIDEANMQPSFSPWR